MHNWHMHLPVGEYGIILHKHNCNLKVNAQNLELKKLHTEQEVRVRVG